jgi:hypothetical protein
MLLQGSTINQNVIHKHYHKFSKEWFQYVVHFKRHNLKLIVVVMCFKCYFELIFRCHSHLVEPYIEIQLVEELRTSQLIKNFINKKHWEFAFDGES